MGWMTNFRTNDSVIQFIQDDSFVHQEMLSWQPGVSEE